MPVLSAMNKEPKAKVVAASDVTQSHLSSFRHQSSFSSSQMRNTLGAPTTTIDLTSDDGSSSDIASNGSISSNIGPASGDQIRDLDRNNNCCQKNNPDFPFCNPDVGNTSQNCKEFKTCDNGLNFGQENETVIHSDRQSFRCLSNFSNYRHLAPTTLQNLSENFDDTQSKENSPTTTNKDLNEMSTGRSCNFLCDQNVKPLARNHKDPNDSNDKAIYNAKKDLQIPSQHSNEDCKKPFGDDGSLNSLIPADVSLNFDPNTDLEELFDRYGDPDLYLHGDFSRLEEIIMLRPEDYHDYTDMGQSSNEDMSQSPVYLDLDQHSLAQQVEEKSVVKCFEMSDGRDIYTKTNQIRFPSGGSFQRAERNTPTAVGMPLPFMSDGMFRASTCRLNEAKCQNIESQPSQVYEPHYKNTPREQYRSCSSTWPSNSLTSGGCFERMSSATSTPTTGIRRYIGTSDLFQQRASTSHADWRQLNNDLEPQWRIHILKASMSFTTGESQTEMIRRKQQGWKQPLGNSAENRKALGRPKDQSENISNRPRRSRRTQLQMKMYRQQVAQSSQPYLRKKGRSSLKTSWQPPKFYEESNYLRDQSRRAFSSNNNWPHGSYVQRCPDLSSVNDEKCFMDLNSGPQYLGDRGQTNASYPVRNAAKLYQNTGQMQSGFKGPCSASTYQGSHNLNQIFTGMEADRLWAQLQFC